MGFMYVGDITGRERKKGEREREEREGGGGGEGEGDLKVEYVTLAQRQVWCFAERFFSLAFTRKSPKFGYI